MIHPSRLLAAVAAVGRTAIRHEYGLTTRARQSAVGSILATATPTSELVEGQWSTSIAPPSASPRSLVILLRHGDRAPIFRNHNPEVQEADIAFWMEKMVPADEIHRLAQLFEVILDDPETLPPADGASFPFGCLTSMGLDHVRSVGNAIREHYGASLIDSAEFNAWSTNYLRTQLSCQAMLEGLRGGVGGVQIRVKGTKNDFLNNFEAYPRLMLLLTAQVEGGQSFLEYENKAGAALKQQLFEAAPDIFLGNNAKSKFSWMKCADFFWCNSAHQHGLPTPLQSLAEPTIKHLTWRFSQFYGSVPLLSTMVASLLKGVLDNLKPVSEGDENSDKVNITVLSCHDVTIMALIYALKAKILHQHDGNEGGYWPRYGSCMIFERIVSEEGVEQVQVILDGERLMCDREEFSNGGGSMKDWMKLQQEFQRTSATTDADDTCGTSEAASNPGMLHD